MKTEELLKLPPLTLVLVEDDRLGGYTAFFKQFPDIISQGETEDDAVVNLQNTVHDVFLHLSKESASLFGTAGHIIQKKVNFCSENYV
jgi:hypothetical protein